MCTDFILRGNSIKKHLKGCEKAAFFAATISDGIDRQLRIAQVSDITKAFVMDSLASVAVEQVCDKFEQILKEQTNGVMDIPVGSLYPALYKLIDAGLISDYKMPAGKRLMRVYYHLEASGKKRLELLLKDYRETHEAINNILNYTGDEEIHE